VSNSSGGHCHIDDVCRNERAPRVVRHVQSSTAIAHHIARQNRTVHCVARSIRSVRRCVKRYSVVTLVTYPHQDFNFVALQPFDLLENLELHPTLGCFGQVLRALWWCGTGTSHIVSKISIVDRNTPTEQPSPSRMPSALS
jgi:hypothetical protein